MPEYHLNIHNSVEKDVTIDADNSTEAMNAAFNALSMFACRNFPPPDYVSIDVTDKDSQPVGNVKLTFTVEFADGTLS